MSKRTEFIWVGLVVMWFFQSCDCFTNLVNCWNAAPSDWRRFPSVRVGEIVIYPTQTRQMSPFWLSVTAGNADPRPHLKHVRRSRTSRRTWRHGVMASWRLQLKPSRLKRWVRNPPQLKNRSCYKHVVGRVMYLASSLIRLFRLPYLRYYRLFRLPVSEGNTSTHGIKSQLRRWCHVADIQINHADGTWPCLDVK